MKLVQPAQPGARWALLQIFSIPDKNDPSRTYLKRLRIVQTPWFGLYVHWIYLPDSDRDPHDHPWNFATWVVRGGYSEARYPWVHVPHCRRCDHVWPRWSVHRVPLADAHRITHVEPNTVTVVAVGRRVHHWGFHTETDGFIPWEQYVAGEAA